MTQLTCIQQHPYLSPFSNSPLYSSLSSSTSRISVKYRVHSSLYLFFKDCHLSSIKQLNLRQFVSQVPQTSEGISVKPDNNDLMKNFNLAILLGVLAISQVAEPAMAVTGVNHEEDLISILLNVAVVAFGYFLIMPPIIMNWLRIRWYKRNLLEMYVQFMLVFIFFPGILVWAPFLNFRKFPRDPNLRYPWAKPENPSAIRGGFRKYPWATIEDYE